MKPGVRHALVRVGRVCGGLRGARLHLGRVGHERPEGLHQLVGRDPVLRRDRDRVEPILLLEERLRRRHVEDRDGRAADRVDRAELRDPRDLVLPLYGPERGHPTSVTDGEAVVARGVRVDHHLVDAVRPLPFGQPQGREAGLARVEADAEGTGRPADLLAVGGDEFAPGFESDWRSMIPRAAASTSGRAQSPRAGRREPGRGRSTRNRGVASR